MMPISVILSLLLVSPISFQVEGFSEMCKTEKIQTIMPAPFHSICKNLNMSLNFSEPIAFMCKSDAITSCRMLESNK